MRKGLVFIVCYFIVTGAYSQENKTIKDVLAELTSFNQKENPPDTVFAAHPLGTNKEEDFIRRGKFYVKMANKLDKIDPISLSEADKVNLELVKYSIADEVISFSYKAYLNPILSDEGFHTRLPRLANRVLTNEKDVRLYFHTLKAIPAYVEDHLQLMRKGLKLGISQPAAALAGFEKTYTTHIVDSVQASLFWTPLQKKPSFISTETWTLLTAEAEEMIRDRVIPSFRKIKDFFEQEYIPTTRKTLGASAMPDGQDYYRKLVKFHTTTNLGPDDVYNVGVAEVDRIRKEMDSVIRVVNFKGSFTEFINFLRTDKQFFVQTPEALLKEASYIAKKIDGQLPRLFGKLPRQPYGVEAVPDYLAPSYTTGRYSGASIKGKRGGMYWVNTYNLPARTLYTLEALTLHEAMPGHHLQVALSQELMNLPEFRQRFYVNAFGEGWGLYSEFLGYELGLYKDPYSLFGRLTYEMWRACRLVIDVGIHWKGWTKEQAVNYLANNTALSLHEVNTEVNRYISWPGQALAYKMGEIKIRELRRKAEAELKEAFDIRAFHDLVLSEGSVTLSILEEMVNNYIQKEKKKKRPLK
jgi:uncharacterized protein (DUF885 family)